MRALLDVNVLIALLDGAHAQHRQATEWLGREISTGWASCPITQNGCVRILAQPGYPSPLPVAAVADRLGRAVLHAAHAFWPDDISLLDSAAINHARLMGHRQVTDAYLLALAVRNSGRFVTFDRRIDPVVVVGARQDQLIVIE